VQCADRMPTHPPTQCHPHSVSRAIKGVKTKLFHVPATHNSRLQLQSCVSALHKARMVSLCSLLQVLVLSEAVKWSSSREVLNWQRKFLLGALFLTYFYHLTLSFADSASLLLLLLDQWATKSNP
jgi:hypothetical protein